ncbi:MAG: OmpA family protein [Pseudomonadota bacterium]
MKTTHKTLQLVLAAALGAAALSAQAQSAASGYVQDSRGAPAKSGAGLCWRAGYWTPAMATAECDADLAPRPAAAPAPAPAVAPAPAPAAAPVAPKKCDFAYTLKNDETFEFNKAALKPGAQTGLDAEVVAKLASCGSVKVILITGHSDRLGSHSYNQVLSEKRAEAVKAYLVAKGVASDKIETMGAGKTQPVPGVKCADNLKRKDLIACLAPNRRVTIEVQGSAK